MQLGGTVLVIEPERPVHARQGGQQCAVDELELVGKVGEPGVVPGGGDLASEFEENLPEQLGIENGLRLGETAQAYWAGADVLLNPREVARRAEAAHGIDHWIEQTEEKEAEVVGLEQFAFGAPREFFDCGSCALRLGESDTKFIEKLAAGELLLIDLVFCPGHGSRKAGNT